MFNETKFKYITNPGNNGCPSSRCQILTLNSVFQHLVSYNVGKVNKQAFLIILAARQVVVAAPVLADQTLAVVQAPVTPVPLRDLLLTAAAAILVAARAIKSILA